MTLMNSLITNTTPTPPKMIVYGQPGVGKTTFAASANAVLLDCENGAGAVTNLTRTPYLQSWPQMRKWLVELADLDKTNAPQALAIDTIDWMVQRIVEHVVHDLDPKAGADLTSTLGTAHGGTSRPARSCRTLSTAICCRCSTPWPKPARPSSSWPTRPTRR